MTKQLLKFKKRLAKILNQVYIHGVRKSTDISNLPRDEITIAEAIILIQKEIENLKKESYKEGMMDTINNRIKLDMPGGKYIMSVGDGNN